MLKNTRIKNLDNVMSFGYDCSIAYHLSLHGLIKNKFLFDDIVSFEIAKLADLLLCEGLGWFEDVEIKPKEKHYGKPTWYITCKKYNVISVHDAPLKWDKVYATETVRNTKTEQLKHLIRALRLLPEHIYILRTNTKDTKAEDTVYFRETIAKLRNDKPFTIFLFQETEEHLILNSIPNMEYFPVKAHAHYEGSRSMWLYDTSWNYAFDQVYSKIERAS